MAGATLPHTLQSRKLFSTTAQVLHAEESGERGSGNDEEDALQEQAHRIVEAGSKRLFRSEEGREKLREGSFNMDATAETMLGAASDAVREGDEAAGVAVTPEDADRAKVGAHNS